MSHFPVLTPDNAPAESKAMLEKSKAQFGMIPNLHAAMAASPALLGAYRDMSARVGETSLTAHQRHVAWLTINLFHECHYCVPAHTALAHNDKLDPTVIKALRAGEPLPDAQLEALRVFTLKLVEQRGDVADADLQAFFAAGYDHEAVAGLLVIVAHKVLSNYFNHLADTPVDAPFAKFIDDPMGA